jgi:membrane fusion protein (multidrug efflux system)
VHTLKQETWKEAFRAYGVVEAAEEVDVSTDAAGTVRAVRCAEGKAVKEGAVIVEFEAAARGLQVKQSKSGIQAAQARLEQARKNAERQRALFANQIATSAELDAAETELRQATAQLDGALAGHRLAQHQLAKAAVLSPVAGVVARRNVEVGEAVLPGRTLCTIQVVRTVRVVTYVTEREINALQVGAQFSVHSPGAPGHEFVGRIESLGARADARTGNFPVKLAVANDDGLLRPGMSARVELRGIEHPEALLLPGAALVDRNRRRVAYRVVDGKAREVEPVVGAVAGDRLPVLRGLAAGDQVIVSGLAHVVDGSEVEVAGGTPATTPSTAPSPSAAPSAR